MQSTSFKNINKSTDRDLLLSTLILAIEELEKKLRRVPNKDEVFDYFFSKARDDPEAQELEKRLTGKVRALLRQWC